MTASLTFFGSIIVDYLFAVPSFALFNKTGMGAEDALHLPTHTQAPGGKGANQAVAAARAGGKVQFFGAVGAGSNARYMLEQLTQAGIDTAGIAISQARTGCAAIFVLPDGKHKVVVSQGANLLAKAQQVPDSAISNKHMLVLQNELDHTECLALAARAKQHGAQVLLNLAPATPFATATLAHIDHLVLNQPEAETLGMQLNLAVASLPDLAQQLAQQHNLHCMITLAEHGSLAASPKGELWQVPALPVKAIDTIGAGDAYVGAYAAALGAGLAWHEALRHGAVAGSLACTKMGAQTALPDNAAIMQALPQLPASKKL